jgi:hypothetical protein
LRHRQYPAHRSSRQKETTVTSLALTAARTVPPHARSLQQRRDSDIWARTALQAVALAGLLAVIVTR